ncbi:hypothetical protein SAMN05216570_2290 [Dyella sp. OK004]|uniref:hypothetical protein n=1 Tax=Dyella sp. OK004 TaxID=1855292 RepID=UPI0008E3251D|nr:hypothetical protein [Dyella sp. OK004]SFS07616.1 hypothetical protein SAMN05216570_2290 [Dyella sp. OK004]
MNELEWHRQMRALREPVSPRRDLWPDIAAALDADAGVQTPTARASRRQAWLLAAGFAGLSLLAGSLNLQLQRTQHPAAPATDLASVDHWKPTDPRLAGAAVELDAARMELQQAIQQAPHSPALQRLLDRTEKRQLQLRQMENQAG